MTQPGLRRTILVEMHKLATMRMTAGIGAGALGIVAIFTLVTLLTAGREPTDGLPGLAGEEGQRLLLSSGSFAAVAIVVLGILVTAGEYRHRTIVGSLLFEPRRGRLLGSKIAVVAAISLVIGAVASALAVGVGALGLRSRGIGLDLGSGELAAIIAGTTGYVGVTAVIGCAVGALVREQITAVVATLGVIWIADPLISQVIPGSVASARGAWQEPDGRTRRRRAERRARRDRAGGDRARPHPRGAPRPARRRLHLSRPTRPSCGATWRPPSGTKREGEADVLGLFEQLGLLPTLPYVFRTGVFSLT